MLHRHSLESMLGEEPVRFAMAGDLGHSDGARVNISRQRTGASAQRHRAGADGDWRHACWMRGIREHVRHGRGDPVSRQLHRTAAAVRVRRCVRNSRAFCVLVQLHLPKLRGAGAQEHREEPGKSQHSDNALWDPRAQCLYSQLELLLPAAVLRCSDNGRHLRAPSNRCVHRIGVDVLRRPPVAVHDSAEISRCYGGGIRSAALFLREEACEEAAGGGDD
mmetsp:Transcript_62490/g.129810  ORF Transcript_62490/g.129810 Transcript_62490/m.129810 type:complete len:220 (+) Transcript_62490:638-1297(+)